MVKEGYSLLVRNLRYETSPEKIEHTFEKYGKVRDVYLPLDYHTRKPRGFGFVEFYDENDARDALEALDRTYIDGNQVAVVIAQDRRKSPETMRRVQRVQSDRGSRRIRDDSRRYRSRSRSRSPPRMKKRRYSRSPSYSSDYGRRGGSESPRSRDRHGSPGYHPSYRSVHRDENGKGGGRRGSPEGRRDVSD